MERDLKYRVAKILFTHNQDHASLSHHPFGQVHAKDITLALRSVGEPGITWIVMLEILPNLYRVKTRRTICLLQRSAPNDPSKSPKIATPSS